MELIQCGNCGQTLRQSNPLPAGKAARCPKCGAAILPPQSSTGTALSPVVPASGPGGALQTRAPLTVVKQDPIAAPPRAPATAPPARAVAPTPQQHAPSVAQPIAYPQQPQIVYVQAPPNAYPPPGYYAQSQQHVQQSVSVRVGGAGCFASVLKLVGALGCMGSAAVFFAFVGGMVGADAGAIAFVVGIASLFLFIVGRIFG